MIRGTVNARHEPLIPLRLRGPSGIELEVDAVIDTGFTGVMILPAAIITALDLPVYANSSAILGDGTVRPFDTYLAVVEWDGVWQSVVVSELGDEISIGTGLLAGHEMYVEFVPGGVVDITAMP